VMAQAGQRERAGHRERRKGSFSKPPMLVQNENHYHL
jgi:hypothetical protein